MVSATDLITYIGVPLTVAGVIPLLWNMFKALWIRRKLSKSIIPMVRPFCTLIADPAAGTVTVVTTTPELAQPGLWPAIKDVNSMTTMSFREMIKGYISYKIQWREREIAEARQLEKHVIDRQDDAPTDHVPEEDLVQLSYHRMKPQMMDTASPQRFLTSWIRLCWHVGFFLNPVPPRSSSLRPVEQQRHIVDIDLRTGPMLLQMGWEQFVWMALALGVDPYNQEFKRLLSILADDNDDMLGASSDLVIRTHDRIAAFRIGRMEGKLVAELNPSITVYDLRAAFAAQHMMAVNREPDSQGFRRPVIRPSNTNNCGSLLGIVKIDQAGLRVHKFAPGVTLIGCKVSSCTYPFLATLQWVLYTRQCRFGQSYKGHNLVSQELLEMRERSLWYLCRLHDKEMLQPALKELFPEGDMASDIARVLAASMAGSEYVKQTRDLSELWDRTKQLSRATALRKRVIGVRVIVPSQINENFDILKTSMVRGFRFELEAADQTLRERLWSALDRHSTWQELRKRLRLDRVPRALDDDQAQALNADEILVRIFIALAPWDRVARSDWSLSSAFLDQISELDQLIHEGVDKGLSKERREDFEKMLGQIDEMFKKGVFSAPISPVLEVFGSNPSISIPENAKIFVV